MTTSLDSLYAAVAAAKTAMAPLKITLQQKTDAWQAAVEQLGLPNMNRVGNPHRHTAPVDGYAPVYTTADLEGLANDYLAAKIAFLAAKTTFDAASAAVASAIRGLGLP